MKLNFSSAMFLPLAIVAVALIVLFMIWLLTVLRVEGFWYRHGKILRSSEIPAPPSMPIPRPRPMKKADTIEIPSQRDQNVG